ncbi:MAG: hypothetical protein GY845_04275 [Planctomycetes bacterium]|nr:hypothetical protein [Planctomycetota bacterium]
MRWKNTFYSVKKLPSNIDSDNFGRERQYVLEKTHHHYDLGYGVRLDLLLQRVASGYTTSRVRGAPRRGCAG